MSIRGRAWKFGDNISTDHIAAGKLFHLRSNLPELAKHTLEDVRPEFVEQVSEGDLVVGGDNFGLGSSREHAPTVIKLVGAGAVVAKSFARIFFRNCINIGLPAIVCDTDRINDGDELELSLEEGELRDITTGETFTFPALPPVMSLILTEGGLIEHVQRHGGLAVGPESAELSEDS